MKVRPLVLRGSWLLVASLATASAFGQTMYRCASTSGTYLSDRPCSGSAQPSAALRAIGPLPERNVRGTYSPTLGKAPEYLTYMSAECAQMNDAVRTGPARGLTGATMSELITNYRQRCSEDEQQASQKWRELKNDERQQRKLAEASQKAEIVQAKLSAEQCNEMLRILAGRRQRAAAMNAGEQQDLERFEANYKARCKSG
jgi:hypothetical protein